MEQEKLIRLQNALTSVLHHIEDAEHTTDPEYRSGSVDDAEEAAVEAMEQLPPELSTPPLKDHFEEELTEPEHEEPHEKAEVAVPDEKKQEAADYLQLRSKVASVVLYTLLTTRPSI